MRPIHIPIAVVIAATALACNHDGPTWSDTQVRQPVRVEVVRPAPHRSTLACLGTVRPPATIPITAPLSGRITYSRRFGHGLRTGVAVAAGESLATIANPDAEHRLAEAEIRLESARAELDRWRRSFAEHLVAEAEVEQRELEAKLAEESVASARSQATLANLVAPVAGTLVVTGAPAPSTRVEAGTAIAAIASNGAPRIEGWAAGRDSRLLRPGLAATVGDGATATVTEVATVVDEAGTLRFAAVAEPDSKLPPPGEGVELQVELDLRPSALTVPENALVFGSGQTAVYLVDGHTARRAPVTTGGRGGGRVEITSGLGEGSRVVVSDVSFLEDGAAVDVTDTVAPATAAVPAS